MNKAKTFTGKVVSAKTPNTAIVAVSSTFRHPLYKKAVRRTRRFAVHYESITLTIGDNVEIAEIRPMSRTKHFIVTKKL